MKMNNKASVKPKDQCKPQPQSPELLEVEEMDQVSGGVVALVLLFANPFA